MNQLVCAFFSHTHYWYEVGMLKVLALDAIEVRGIITREETKVEVKQLASGLRLKLYCTSQEEVVIAFAKGYRTCNQDRKVGISSFLFEISRT